MQDKLQLRWNFLVDAKWCKVESKAMVQKLVKLMETWIAKSIIYYNLICETSIEIFFFIVTVFLTTHDMQQRVFPYGWKFSLIRRPSGMKYWSEYNCTFMVGTEAISAPKKTTQSPRDWNCCQEIWGTNLQREKLALAPFKDTWNWGSYSNQKSATLLANH